MNAHTSPHDQDDLDQQIDDKVDEFIANLGVPVHDTPLMRLALTHSSWVNEQTEKGTDNERLEFLGDAVLDLVVGEYLYKRFPEMKEGEMTSLRAALVRSDTLADFALQINIDQYLLMGYGEKESGGQAKPATLCAAFEAVIGALYIDSGFVQLTPLVQKLIRPMLEIILMYSLHKDPKSEFQMFAQAELGSTPRYEVISERGPDHEKLFTLQLIVGDDIWGEGQGTSKRRAAMEAARDGLIRAEIPGW